jgi:DNA-binding response OmpR family regulator
VLLQRDDEAEMVARLLAGTFGFEVDLTTDPAAALNHLPGSGVDAVVMGMDLGPERAPRIIERVRRLRDSGASGVPVVVIADEDRRSDRLRTWEAGADGVLTKPVHIDDVVAALRLAMKRSSRQREKARSEAATQERTAPSR